MNLKECVGFIKKNQAFFFFNLLHAFKSLIARIQFQDTNKLKYQVFFYKIINFHGDTFSNKIEISKKPSFAGTF